MVKQLVRKKIKVVAEVSANHGNDINVVKQTILKAKEIGCDAVKLQTYTPDTITLNCDNEYFQINSGTIWDGTTLYELYKKAYTPWEWHEELFAFAENAGIILFSTPFDKTAVDLLEKCGNPIYKIASFEITDIPLIKYVASKGKPMIISTGIATESEIWDALDACHKAGNHDVTLLKCTSQYPARLEDANLNTMVDMKDRFGVHIGLSDHTEDGIVAISAAALGAEVIEKHFILDRKIGGPDASFSIEPDAFKKLIQSIRKVEKALGSVSYELDEPKCRNRKFARSLFIVKDVEAGEIINKENVRSIRPSDGMPPKELEHIIGSKFAISLKRGTPLRKDFIELYVGKKDLL